MILNRLLFLFILISLPLIFLGCGDEQSAIFGFGQSPLIKAVDTGDTTAVRALLAKGGNPNEADAYGWTALMISATKGYDDSINALLDKGANINGETIKKWTALMRAAENGQTKTVELLLKRGANFNAKNQLGVTSLMLAVEKGRTETVKVLLLNQKLDLNVKDINGRTALSIATNKKMAEIIYLLKRAGARQ